MKKILILGAGVTGRSIAIDLCKQHDVTCSDIQMCSLEMLSPQYPIAVIPSDFKDKKSLKELIRPFDMVINATAPAIGFETLKTVIEVKKNVVNLSPFPEKFLSLEDDAKKNNVTAVMNFSDDSELSASTLFITNLILEGKVLRKGIFNIEKELITE